MVDRSRKSACRLRTHEEPAGGILSAAGDRRRTAGKGYGTEDRSLWNPMRDWQWQRGGSSCTDELRAAGQVRREPLKDNARETIGRSQTLQQWLIWSFSGKILVWKWMKQDCSSPGQWSVVPLWHVLLWMLKWFLKIWAIQNFARYNSLVIFLACFRKNSRSYSLAAARSRFHFRVYWVR